MEAKKAKEEEKKATITNDKEDEQAKLVKTQAGPLLKEVEEGKR